MVIIVLETPSRLSLAFEVDILPTGRLGRKKKIFWITVHPQPCNVIDLTARDGVSGRVLTLKSLL